MGSIYAIRPKPIPVTLPNGTGITVFPIRFLYKPSTQKVENFYRKIIERLKSDFENLSKPFYVTFIYHNIKCGSEIYIWNRPGILIKDTDPDFPGDRFGILKRKKGKWFCELQEKENIEILTALDLV